MKSKNLLKSTALKAAKFGVAALVLSLLSNSSLPSSAYAGGSDRGGGDAIVCFPNDQQKMFSSLADYSVGSLVKAVGQYPVGVLYSGVITEVPVYTLYKATGEAGDLNSEDGYQKMKLADQSFKSSDQQISNDIQDLIFEMVVDGNSSDGLALQKAFNEINFKFATGDWHENGPTGDLAQGSILDLDTGLVVNGRDCVREQIATQNFATGDVTMRKVNMDGSGDRSSQTQPFFWTTLKIHEALVRVGNSRGLKLAQAENFARDYLGKIVNSPDFGSKLFQKLLSDSDANFDYGAVVKSIWDLSGGKEKTFLQMIQALQFPCSFNSSAFDTVTKAHYQVGIGLSTLDFTSSIDQQFTAICK
jgi:hypothetical protein